MRPVASSVTWSSVTAHQLNKLGGDFLFVDRNLVQRMKDQYPPGTRIELDFMGDDPRPIAPGTKGTVRIVDDMGTVHCYFDNGRRLGLIPGEDSFHVIAERTRSDRDAR